MTDKLMRILLAEDDSLLADGMVRSLAKSGYQVEVAPDGRCADLLLASQKFDLMILDLGLPNLDGHSVLRRLREREQITPVLVVSARMDLEERVNLLNAGADDYLVKPVALVELEARMQAVLRRAQPISTPTLKFGRLELDTLRKAASLGEEILELNVREWSAVEFLAKLDNRIFSKEQIFQAIYPFDQDLTPNAIEKFISRLRLKLETAGVFIRTVRGLGYFIDDTSDESDAPT